MGKLNNIAVSGSDTITIVTNPKEVISHSCPATTTAEDVEYVRTIGEAVIDGITIISFAIIVCVFLNFVYRFLSNWMQMRYEMVKRREEIQVQSEKVKRDDIWRGKEHIWKIEYDNLWKEKDLEYKLKEKSLDLNIKEAEKSRNQADNFSV